MQGLSEKRYDPQKTVARWYQVWVERGYFHADVQAPVEPFCIVIPPPNITDSLHMGHALNTTLQDILVRWKRMDGYNTLWLPGTDHAGIATQWVVEQQSARERFTMDEGLSRAVRKVFVSLYRGGYIYRGEYIIQWCPRCMTALSDLEVEYEERDGKLYYINYGPLTLSTTTKVMPHGPR
jgi:valyl-tRNA synthetase